MKTETRHKWKSDEPWKKHEPGSRLTSKQKGLQNRSQNERAEMEQKSRQNVKVIFRDWGFGLPNLIKNFDVELSIPLTTEEIMKRMSAAFPELKLKQPEEGIH